MRRYEMESPSHCHWDRCPAWRAPLSLASVATERETLNARCAVALSEKELRQNCRCLPTNDPRRPVAGVFISRGMTVGIPPGGFTLSIAEDGTPSGSLTIHVHFDVCPTWIELALQHLTVAKGREAERKAAWAGADEDQKAASLEREFEASMQAIMASAVAIDAFYAVLRKKAEVSEDLVATWRKNRTARPVQVAEVIRIAFGLGDVRSSALRKNLQEIYRLRDLAVHPSGDIEAPIQHPELDVGVEWRFAYFRYANAELVVNTTLRMLSEIVAGGAPKNGDVRTYADVLRGRLEQIGIVTKRLDPANSESAGGNAEAC